MNPMISILVYLSVGTVGGYLGSRLKIPAGVLIGAMVAVILFKVATQRSWQVPSGYNFLCQIFIGVMVGTVFYPGMFKGLGNLMIPVVVSTLVLVGTGLVLAVIFKKLGMLDMGTGYIGTSPGAMSAMIPLAVGAGINPVLVICFHFFRVVFVLLTAPLIFRYLNG
jgi:membrane AbrB-like protein